MTKANQDIGTDDDPWVLGDYRQIVITLTDADPDITGATPIRWGLYSWSAIAEPSATASVSKSLGAGIDLTTAASGIITITVDGSDTEDLTPGRYYHECEITDVGGNVSTIMTGKVTMSLHRLT